MTTNARNVWCERNCPSVFLFQCIVYGGLTWLRTKAVIHEGRMKFPARPSPLYYVFVSQKRSCEKVKN